MPASQRLAAVVRHGLLWLGAAGALGCGGDAAPPPVTPRPPAAVAPVRSNAEIRDLDIAFFQTRAARDPTGAMDLARLAALYLARSRESGDPRDAIAAEEAARKSLRNRTARNGQASEVLVASLIAQHRFDEALTISRQLRNESPETASLQAVVGEIEMELGQYDSARVSFAAAYAPMSDLNVTPRLSRWAEIQGKPERALALQRSALAVALREPSIPREQVAWFWLRLGDIQLRMGQPLAADSSYRSGLALHHGDYRLLSALARSAAAQGRWQEAIAHGEEAIAVNLDPTTLGTLSDAYAAVGDTVRSSEYANTLEIVVVQQPGAYHRAWSLFLLDRGRHLSVVTRKIREELKTRRDVYGYDLLAWALYKRGRHAEASAAMTLALREGTRDAMLYYHAGMIEQALGRTDAARTHLEKALAFNPHFQPGGAGLLRTAMAALPAPRAPTSLSTTATSASSTR